MSTRASAPAGRSEAAPRRRRIANVPLAARMLIASVVVAILVGGVFIALLLAISTLRDATVREARAKAALTAAVTAENAVLDLETGLRGLILAEGDERFLGPAAKAKLELPQRLEALEQLVASDPEQSRRVQGIKQAVNDYINDYFVNVVEIARDSPDAARAAEATAEGKRYTDTIRERFAAFQAAEDAEATLSAETASDRADQAIALGAVGLVLTAALIVLFGAYLARSIARAGARRRAWSEPDRRRRALAPARRGRPRGGRRADPLLQHHGRGARARAERSSRTRTSGSARASRPSRSSSASSRTRCARRSRACSASRHCS